MKIILTSHPAMLNCSRSHIPGVGYPILFFFYFLNIVVTLASASFKVYLFNYLVILFFALKFDRCDCSMYDVKDVNLF